MSRARLVIDLDLTTEPIEGCLTSPAAGARAFVGWLDLIAALDHARAAELQADPLTADARSGCREDRAQPRG